MSWAWAAILPSPATSGGWHCRHFCTAGNPWVILLVRQTWHLLELAGNGGWVCTSWGRIHHSTYPTIYYVETSLPITRIHPLTNNYLDPPPPPRLELVNYSTTHHQLQSHTNDPCCFYLVLWGSSSFLSLLRKVAASGFWWRCGSSRPAGCPPF